MKDFNKLKIQFRQDRRDMRMDLPEPLDNLDMDDRVVGGQITITKSVAVNLLFLHSLLIWKVKI